MRRAFGRWGGPAAVHSGERGGSASGASAEALAAWRTRLPGAELADLVWDRDLDAGPPPWSVGPEGEPAGVTAGENARPLCYAGPDLRIAAEVDRRAPRALRGRLVPPASGAGPDLSVVQVRVELSRVDVDVELDSAGGFHVPGLPRGPMRLVVSRPGRPSVATSWVLID